MNLSVDLTDAGREKGNRQRRISARLERLPFHFWHVKMRLIVGAATFFDGLDALMIAYVLPTLIPLWHLRSNQAGLLISSGYAGQLLGSLFFGWYAERQGRLRALISSVIVMALGSLLCTFSWTYASLLLFRFIQGCGLGGEVPVAATYINELAKAEGRGKFVLVYELLFSTGLVMSAFLGWWIVPRFGWRLLFLLGSVIGIIVPALQRKLPESPRWLAAQGRLEEADQIVSQIELVVSENGSKALPPVASPLALSENRKMDWKELFEGRYLRRTLTAWVIWFCAFFCNFGLATWMPTLYVSVYHLTLPVALKFSVATQFVGLAGCAVCAFTIDEFGRKGLIASSFFGLAAFMAVIWRMGGALGPGLLLALVSAAFFFNSAICIALWLYTPEIYPTRMRALGGGVSTAWYRVAVIIAPLLVAVFVGRGAVPSAFAMFAVVALVGGLITSAFAVETKGRVLEEVSP